MFNPDGVGPGVHSHSKSAIPDYYFLALSLVLQLTLGLFLGHVYDIRIYMATGYLVDTGQDPYIAQNLDSVFHNTSFQGMTSVGYPPPWPLVTGLIYLVSYKVIPNLLLYNLAIKIPIIAANICLAYLVVRILKRLGANEKVTQHAWLFMLFNPFILYISTAWGQFDSIVALLSLLALMLVIDGKMIPSAILLALAISFKPTAIPLVPAVFVFLRGRPIQQTVRYFVICFMAVFLFCVAPFAIFRWDPTPILQHWNAHFTVGGGMSFMTFLELLSDSYQLPGLWWLVGLIWVPALGIAALMLKPGGAGLLDLLKKSTALVMIFFLFRAWLSETNLILVLPLVLILTSLGKLDPRIITAIWIVPLVFSFFNTSTFQLLFPSLPALMERLLQLSDIFRTARLIIRTFIVIPWLVIGGWIVINCLKEAGIRKKQFSVN